MKAVIFLVLILLLVLLVMFAVKYSQSPTTDTPASSALHVYATWDTMELDKCVAAWLIVRFIDKDAKFVFYPQGTEIKQGIAFDVPGAAWSRKHRKCTSDCILESLDIDDSSVQKIVETAHNVELNFWRLGRFPQAQECFDDVRRIIETVPDRQQCYKKTCAYFDMLYDRLRQQSGSSNKR